MARDVAESTAAKAEDPGGTRMKETGVVHSLSGRAKRTSHSEFVEVKFSCVVTRGVPAPQPHASLQQPAHEEKLPTVPMTLTAQLSSTLSADSVHTDPSALVRTCSGGHSYQAGSLPAKA
jgi:hypothetical protein